jgi:hypothetical protein
VTSSAGFFAAILIQQLKISPGLDAQQVEGAHFHSTGCFNKTNQHVPTSNFWKGLNISPPD